MRILISGSSGMIGSFIISELTKKGHSFYRLIRKKEKLSSQDLFWNPADQIIDRQSCENFDIVIHLSGENISKGKWTERRKQLIRQSRVQSTVLLVRTLAALQHPPRLFVCASGISIFGDRGDETLTEKSSSGKGFLADVVREWEKATLPAKQAGIRTVNLRFGAVLSPQGGMLAKILPIYKLGLGGKLGTGQQYMPWISLHEIPQLIAFLAETNQISGPINTVAPEALTNGEFTRKLAEFISRPAIFKVPAPALRLIYGQMAEELLLFSEKAVPSVLIENNYQFIHPTLQETFKSFQF